ncbi:MAG: condensation domain-containing protein [Solirubrobacterales bacterium]
MRLGAGTGQAWTAAEIVAATRRRPRQGSPGRAASLGAVVQAPPGSPAAVAIAILAATLDLDRVRRGMTFGALGGDSLTATQVLARVWQALDVRLPLSSLAPETELGSFVDLVAAKAGEGRSNGEAEAPLLRSGGTGPEPLTPGQAAIWLSAELTGEAGGTIPVALRLRGELDREALRVALDALVRRHGALALQVTEEAGTLVQRRQPVGIESLPVVEAAEPDLAALVRRHACQPLDLAAPPLLRPLLLRASPRDHLLALAIHHIACDAWSVKVLLGELAALYGGVVAGEPVQLPDEDAGFLDFARWQREQLGRERRRLIAFWRGALASPPPDRWLPTDFERPAYRSGRGGAEQFVLDGALLGELRAFSGEQGVTLFMALLCAYGLVLAEFSGRSDLVVGSPMANRSHPRLVGTVGYLSNTVPIRLDLGGDPSVRELLRRVRRASLDAYDHQGLPLPILIAALSPNRDVSVPPVFQACLVFNEMQAAPMRGLAVEELLLHNGTSPYDLTLYLEQRADSLAGYVEYPADLFRPRTARRLHRRLAAVLEEMIAAPDASAADLRGGAALR